MCGIGHMISAGNAFQRIGNPAAQQIQNSRTATTDLVSVVQQTGHAAPDDGNQCATGCCYSSSLLNAANMATLISMQIQHSMRANVEAVLAPQMRGSACGGAELTQNLFTTLDANGDGMISRAEFDAALGADAAAGSNAQDASGTAPGSTPADQAGATSTAGDTGTSTQDVAASAQDASSAAPGSTPSDQAVGTSTAGHTGTSTQDVAASKTVTPGNLTSTATGQGGSTSVDSSSETTAHNVPTTMESVDPDGLKSTKISYPDGTTVTLTTPGNSDATLSAGAAGDTSSAGSNQLPIESVLATLIRLQAQMTETLAA